MSSGRRILPILAGTAVGLAMATLALEIGARVVDRLQGEPFDAVASRGRIEAVLRSIAAPEAISDPEAGASENLLQPYFAWQDADLQARLSDAGARPKSKLDFDVLVLGGSEAAVLGRAGAEILAASLRKDPALRDRQIRIRAFALDGFKQPQSLMTLVVLLSMGHEPDLVLELDGLDDALLGWSNAQAGTHPLHPSVAHWARTSGGARSDWELAERFHETRVKRTKARALGERILATGVWRSALLEPLAARELEGGARDVVAAEGRAAEYLAKRPREKELDGPRFPKDEDGIAATIADGWERASISMQALCSCRGIAFVHVLEPEPDESPSGAVARVYPRLRAASVRLAARGIHLRDASESFRGRGFRDEQGRPTTRGCEVLAQAAAEAWRGSGPR